MVLWLPLDEPVGIVANNIIAGAPNGFHIGGPVPLLGQKVLNSLGFDGVNDFVTVPNYAGIMLNNTDLSIDAWVLRRDQEGRRVIVSKVGPSSLAGANLPRGYEFYLRNGLMHLWLGGTAITDYSSGVLVPNDNKWHHVAVTVARSAGGLARFYLDGAVAASQAGAVVAPLGNNSRLNVGASTFPGVADFWRGYLDEVEIFDRELAPSEVYGLFKADSAGKCKIRCVVPWDRHYPADGSPVLAQVFFCNDSGVTQTLTYVPEGPMNISGPGTITLLPGECNNVWIRIDRPTNNAPIGSVVVWTLTVYPNFGCPFVCKGSVINPGPIHVTGPDGVVGIPGGRPGNIALGLNGLPPGTPITIRVVGPDMEPDLRVISLNGLPPGVPWLITPGVVTPAADDMTLNIPVRFVEGNAVDNYTILLDADLDGDGQFVTLRSIDVSNPVVAPPTLSITNTADGSVIKWNDDGDGVLEVSESLDGPWKSVPGARSGYINKNAGKQLFFRVTVQIAE